MTISELKPPADSTLGELHAAADTVDDELLPCRANNPELFFAESPTDVEYAKPCARTARSRHSVSPALSSGASPGAFGAVSSSSRE